MKRVLILDYDGTIVDSLKNVCEGFNYAAKRFGLRERTKKEVASLYLDNIYDSLVKIGIPKEKLPDFMSDMRDKYSENKVKVFPKMKEIIDLLRKENKVLIITSNYEKTITEPIKENDIEVDEILGAEKGLSKVEKIGVLKREYPDAEIFYIGDTVGDMKEAREAGVKSIGVSWGYHSRKTLEKAKPDYIADKPEELLEIVKN